MICTFCNKISKEDHGIAYGGKRYWHDACIIKINAARPKDTDGRKGLASDEWRLRLRLLVANAFPDYPNNDGFAGVSKLKRDDPKKYAELKAKAKAQFSNPPKKLKKWAAATGQALLDLLAEAFSKAKKVAGKRIRIGQIIDYERNPVIRKAVLNRAAGVCEYCELPARYYKANGEPLLEPHHIDMVSQGGADDPWFVAAIHPDCHDAAHRAAEKIFINDKLRQVLQSKKVQLLGVAA